MVLPKDGTINSVSDKNKVLQQSVSGTVTDAENVPLAGANILEKGTTNISVLRKEHLELRKRLTNCENRNS